MPSFISYKDMIAAKFKKTGHMTVNTSPLGMVCHRRLGFDSVYLHAKFDHSSRSSAIIGASKFKVGHVTLMTPFLRVISHPAWTPNLTTLASAVPEIG